MSRRALILATRAQLKIAPASPAQSGGLGLTQTEVEDMFDGEPPPRCGKRFFSVHRGGRTNSARHSLDEEYTFYVTITLRVNEPFDKIGVSLLSQFQTAKNGLDVLADQVRSVIHMSYPIMNAANATILADVSTQTVPPATVYGFSEPPVFMGDDDPRRVGASWFNASVEDANPPIGIAQTLRFGHARRLQPLTNIQ